MTTPRLSDTQLAEIQQSVNEKRTEYLRLTSLAGQRQASETQLKVLERLKTLLAGAGVADAVLILGRLKEALRPLEEIDLFLAKYEAERAVLAASAPKP